jgi:1-acyl-sn-glycerol-3-phosphate acyltransferase
MGGIRIDRNIADMDAIRTAVTRMKEGHLLTIFPQGQLDKSETVNSIKSGAVLMALQAGVPIYPMHIYPKEKWYRRRVVVIGDPIDPKALCTRKIPSTADIQRISNILMDEMNRCILSTKEEVK